MPNDLPRSAGVLLHPTSVPGPYPIGDIGPSAHAWIDWLADAGITWWQILPLTPPGYAGSPYQGTSAFASNTMLISPDLLHDDGLIDELPSLPNATARADFEAAASLKDRLLETAMTHLAGEERLDAYRRSNADWLEDYALFVTLKEAHGGGSFTDWPDPLRLRDEGAIATARDRYAERIDREVAGQFIVADQWERLRVHARDRGIKLIGDIPIFVAEDSVDVWTRPELFDLDENRRPRVVAGVPPDYFSETGQLWGNPLYRWEAHADRGYDWWIARLRHTLQQVDLLRIDHFRAFADYWEIPAGSETAEAGEWVLGPGPQFFDAVRNALGVLPLIAEDLGELHAIVPALRTAVGLPGMKIGQFSFDPDELNPPTEWPPDTVGYTGTHDNDTTVGWWDSIDEATRSRAGRLAGIGADDPAHDLVRAVWESPSVIAVAPVQDLLQLPSSARMNRPGTLGDHNWTWRLESLPPAGVGRWLAGVTATTGR